MTILDEYIKIKQRKQKQMKMFLYFCIFVFSCFCVFNKSILAEYYYDNSTVDQLNNNVKELNQKISSRKNRLNEAVIRQKQYLEELHKKQMEKATLANALAILDGQIEESNLKIEDVQIDINLVVLEIEKINTDIEIKTQDIEKGENNLKVILNSLNKEGDKNMLEVFLLNGNLSEFLNQVKYLEDINQGLDKAVKELEKNKIELEDQLQISKDKNEKLAKLKVALDEELIQLEAEKKNKEFILAQTQASEEKYANLVKMEKEEQAKAQKDMASLEAQVRQKLAQIEKQKLKFNDNGFIWPVPQNTITAYFHDPSYPYRYIFEHPGIDISAAQGTPLRAAASGYVAKAHDAGMGYSYIMLVHGDGLATVYGHVSKISVQENQYITQGQIIGATGAMPGTPGAGNLTTGPHLHFEVRLNGIPVNALNYLP